MTMHSSLYSCDVCAQPYQGDGTGGVTVWSWAGIMRTFDLCPDCVARVNAAIDGLAAESKQTSAGTAQQ